ncbi:hypothetical protein ACK2M7_11440 [Chryseobacterium sp. TY4]
MFFLLFYNETPGINLALLGGVYPIVIYVLTPKFLRTARLEMMLIFSFVSCGAFAYYGDFISFFAIYTYGSDNFANFFGSINFNFNIYEVVALSFLGYYITVNIWHISIPILFLRRIIILEIILLTEILRNN